MEKFEATKEKEPKIEIVFPAEGDVRDMMNVFYKSWLLAYPNKELGITVDDIEEVFKNSFSEDTLMKRWQRIKENEERGEKLLLAKEENKVIGLIKVSSYSEKNKLHSIYLLPEYQNKGIGTSLWGEAQKFLDPSKNTIVQLAAYNQQAIDFYSKLGFVDNGKRWDDDKFKMKSGAIIPLMEMEIIQ